jgi:hypothetical protein
MKSMLTNALQYYLSDFFCAAPLPHRNPIKFQLIPKPCSLSLRELSRFMFNQLNC